MLTLVANLGSTSFKFKLFDLTTPGSEKLLASGGAERIGNPPGAWSVDVGGQSDKGEAAMHDHGDAIDLLLARLPSSMSRIEAIGFKAVHGGPISGAVRVDEQVLTTMQQFADVAPAHNPPYIAAMRAFQKKLPGVPQVAAFETAFHQTIPLSRQVYAIPYEWTQMGVRRYGFHGASHRYIATRLREIMPQAKRVISLHLGGSCSICAIDDGKSVANSFGMTAQSGVFHNNRVGDFDAFALLKILAAGVPLETIWKRLGKEGGMAGLSGVSSDMRDVEQAAAGGNERAQLAIDAFVESCRHYVGAYLAVLGGVDALVFTGGIGQYGKAVRAAVCDRMGFAGIQLDPRQNEQAKGSAETQVNAGPVAIWVLPTNEELIVARQTYDVLRKH